MKERKKEMSTQTTDKTTIFKDRDFYIEKHSDDRKQVLKIKEKIKKVNDYVKTSDLRDLRIIKRWKEKFIKITNSIAYQKQHCRNYITII